MEKILISKYLRLSAWCLSEAAHTLISSLSVIVVATLASSVYPAYGAQTFDAQLYEIVITPEDYPVIWRRGSALGVDDTVDLNDPLVTQSLEICNAASNCLQDAVDAGGYYFQNTFNAAGEDVVAYYNTEGRLVGIATGTPDGTESTSSTPSSGSVPAQEIVGTLPGDFSVSPSGAANYSIPIEVPPGTAGVQPELSLNYDSQSGNGVMGVGWNIGGISQITRCPASMAIDGYVGSVNHDDGDKFCLDGQRLILDSGVYGEPNSTYRTEMDSQQEITAKGIAGNGPAYFKVVAQDGTEMTYGYSEGSYDSRMEASIGLFMSATVNIWALGKVQDINGNYYKLAYQQDTEIPFMNGTITKEQGNSVTRIDYTGNDDQGVAPYASVEFIYEDRPDDISLFYGGSGRVIQDRLKKIKTFVDSDPVKTYNITYDPSPDPSTGLSRISQLQECSPNYCKPATLFDWQNGTNELDVQYWDAGTYQDWDYYTLTGDFNGDGLTDLFSPNWPNGLTEARVRLSNGSGFDNDKWTTSGLAFSSNSHEASNNLWPGDYDGDGKTDIAGLDSANRLNIHLSTGSGFSSSTGATLQIATDPNYTWTGDFDGDGRTDIAFNNSANVLVYLSRGTSFELEYWSNENVTLTEYNYTGDFNGDGLTDIAFASGYVLLSSGTGFIKENWAVNTWGPVLNTTYTGDFNGDGLTDIATVYNQTTEITVRIATGKAFTRYTWDSTRNWSDRIMVGDFNGDGMTDIAGEYAGELNVHLSTGNSFEFTQWPVANDWGDAIYTGTADFNGDGLTDIYTSGAPPTYNTVYSVKLSKGLVPNLITSATNGLGNASTVSYSPMTNSAIYTKGGATYPELAVISAKQVVINKTTIDGLGSNTAINYSYEKERVELGGRGSLGFMKTFSTNLDTGLVTEVKYSQAFPYIGMVEKETQTLNGNNLTKTEKTLDRTKKSRPGGFTYIPYVSLDVVKSYDINGVKLKTVETTSSVAWTTGNIKETRMKSYEGNDPSVFYETVTNNTYNSPGTGWCHQYLPTETSTYKTGPLGSSPTAVKQFTYNGLCQLETENGHVDDNGVISTGLTKTHSYDAFGHATGTVISGAGIASRGITTEYDNRGRFPVKVTNEHGHEVTTQSDPRFGGVTSSTDANGLTTTTIYDEFGQQQESIAADGSRVVTETYWCDYGCVVPALTSGAKQRPALFTTRQQFLGGTGSLEQMAPDAFVHYDVLGREIRKETSDATGRTIYADTNYDFLGRVIASTQAYFSNAPADMNVSTTTYDTLSRPVQTTSPDGGIARIEYDGFNVTYHNDVLDPLTGAVTTQSRTEINDVIGQNIQSIDNDGNSVYREFDANGNNVRILNPKLSADGSIVLDIKGTVTTFEYDVFGRKVAMTDPDMGRWTYSYNVLSELIVQTDANSAMTIMSYDKMGRMKIRIDGDWTTTTWNYNDDLLSGDLPATMSVGKLDSVVMTNTQGVASYRQTTDYEPVFGLPVKTTMVLNDQSANTYVTEIAYDRFNRPELVTYPETSPGNSFKVRNVYDTAGVLSEVQSEDGSTSYWKADYRDAASRVIISTLGNGTNTWRTLDAAGRTSLISTADTGANTIYEASYKYDTQGNLRQREETRGSSPLVTEEYIYDSMNRLTTVTANGATTLTNSYDILGNIRNKSDVGVYSYDSSIKPHAVTAANGNSYAYDANGNLTTGAGRNISWTKFNKPGVISTSTDFDSFIYGPNRARYSHYQMDLTTFESSNTIYVGGLYEKITGMYETRHKHYIRAGGQTVATYTYTKDILDDVSESTEYLHRDYQGSVVAVSDETGAVKAQLGFGTFGNRKPVQGASTVDPIIEDHNRGYTGHEHLDSVGLIHMNGRVYNPELGRFLSADPIVQAPNNLQSYNRYTYVFNNPMSFTDPSGFRSLRKSLRSLGGGVQQAVGVGMHYGLKINTTTGWGYTKPARRFMLKHEWARQVGQVAAGACGGCSTLYSAYLTDISGGSYGDIGRAAVIADVTAALFYWAGSSIENDFLKVLAHGAIGGAMSRASGGRFSDGFWAAGLSKWATVSGVIYNNEGGFNNHKLYNTIAASLVGGIISKATGGSFASGSRAAMYGMVFNQLATEKPVPGKPFGSAEELRKAKSRRIPEGLLLDNLHGPEAQMTTYFGNDDMACPVVCAGAAVMGDPDDGIYHTMENADKALKVLKEYPTGVDGYGDSIKALRRQVKSLEVIYNIPQVVPRYESCVRTRCKDFSP